MGHRTLGGVSDHHLGTDRIHTVWDQGLPPALHVRPGDTVTFQTLDASDGNVARRAAAGEIGGPAELVALAAADAFPQRDAPRGQTLPELGQSGLVAHGEQRAAHGVAVRGRGEVLGLDHDRLVE